MSSEYPHLWDTPFALIDIEATGIFPSAHDRIIEVAILKVNHQGDIVDEYTTLVNPLRDIGRQDIHQISAGDVLGAPTFNEIAGDIAVRLSGSIVVGHHVRFDLNFLASEFSRAGHIFPQFPSLCTLELTYKLTPEAPSRKLSRCCEAAGILHEDQHSAIGDARATAALLVYYLNLARQSGLDRSIANSLTRTPMVAHNWLPNPPCGRTHSRKTAAKLQTEERKYLAQLVEQMPGDEATNAQDAEYLLLLDRALEDRLISKDEAEALVGAAASWNMKRADVLDMHRTYMANLVSEALADGVITVSERRDLESVCDMLNLNSTTLEVLLEKPRSQSVLPADDLVGKSICFTGELIGTIDGERITRDIAESLAVLAGLEVQDNVTRTLDLLVVADPHTQSGKAKKARDYGVRIIAEAAFWKAIHARVD